MSYEEARTAPRLDLHLLINLNSFETLEFHEQHAAATYKRGLLRENEISVSYVPEARRFRETGMWGQVVTDSRRTYGFRHKLTHLSLMLMALQKSGKTLSHLKVTQFEELLECPELEGSGFVPDLPSLASLEIKIGNMASMLTGRDEELQASSWVHYLRNLTQLTIQESPLKSNEPDTLELIAFIHFPSLTEVYFKHIRTRYWILLQFLRRHSTTLKKSKIHEPLMEVGDWARFQRDLNADSRLCNVEFEMTWIGLGM